MLGESDKGLWFHQRPSNKECMSATVPSTSSSRKKLRKDPVEDREELDEELNSEDVDSSRSSSDECNDHTLTLIAIAVWYFTRETCKKDLTKQ